MDEAERKEAEKAVKMLEHCVHAWSATIAYLERRSEEVKRYRARDIERLQLLKIQLGTAESPTTKVQ